MAERTAAHDRVLVDNEPGVLARVIGLFSGRGYNIESLTVPRSTGARTCRGSPSSPPARRCHRADQGAARQLVPVHKVQDLTDEGPHVERELALVKVTGDRRAADRGAAHRRHLPRARWSTACRELRLRDHRPTEKLNAFIDLWSRSRSAVPAWSRIGRGGDHPRGHGRAPEHGRLPLTHGSSTMRVYYDRDADLNLIKGKKVAVVGYGSQGHRATRSISRTAASTRSRVALRPGSATRQKAEAAGPAGA